MTDDSRTGDDEAIVIAMFDALSHGDLDGAIFHLADDGVIDASRSRGPVSGIVRGRTEVRSAWGQFLEAWDEVHWDLRLFKRLESGALIFESRPRLRGRASGLETSARGGWLVRVRDGKVTYGALFQSPEDALAHAAAEGEEA